MERRRVKHKATFAERLAAFAEDARERAEALPPSIERDDLLRKVRQADTASHLTEWCNSPGLRPPK